MGETTHTRPAPQSADVVQVPKLTLLAQTVCISVVWKQKQSGFMLQPMMVPVHELAPAVQVPIGPRHTPAMQFSPGGQPQVVLGPEPQTCAFGQQAPPRQVVPAAQQVLPQGVVPPGQTHWQVVGSSTFGSGQVATQVPVQQVWPPVQAETQLPVIGLHTWHAGALHGAGRQVVPHTWAVGQQLPLMQVWPDGQPQVAPGPLPHTWAFGQQLPPMQVVPVEQQVWFGAVPHTWAVRQHAPPRQVVPAAQHKGGEAVQNVVPLGHAPQVGPATLPGAGHSVPPGQQTPWTSTVGQQVWPVGQP
jgi:hypothetical protein